MKLSSILFFMLLSPSIFGQVGFNKTMHDFGELKSYSSFHVDFLLNNTQEKKAWILKIETPEDVSYLRSKESIETNDTTALRLHVAPKKEGKFRYEILVYTSDKAEPTKVILTGKVTEIIETGTNSFTQCPTFDEVGAGNNSNQFTLKVITIDKETKKEIPNTSVSMIQNGIMEWMENTDNNGAIKKPASYGLSYFEANHPNYLPADLGAYINFKRKIIVIELDKKQEVAVEHFVDSAFTSVPVEKNPSEEIIEYSDVTTAFQQGNYQPINVVFVLDVSSSMRHENKLELMKFALNQLAGQLRPQDKIGIVTYSSDARVLLPSTSCDQPQEIIEEVKNIKAGGYTAGGNGIKLGFKTAFKGKIDGVNHIVVITDGAFNRGDEDYKKYIKKYAKKDVSMSVVGIKINADERGEMQEIARLGQGEFVSIQNIGDAELNLLLAVMEMTKM